MRVIFAGLFSYGAVLLAFLALSSLLEGKWSQFIVVPLIVLTFFLAMLGSYILFNRGDETWPHQTVEELESEGLVVSTEFQAKRAFEIEEFEDEGSHYFVELNDGTVLYLNGQYLYDYEAIDDDPEANQERKFPCSEFLVKRHKTEGYVLEIVTGGVVIEPEEIAPYFTESDYRSNTIPTDGDLIRDKSFDEIKQERLKSR